MAFTTHRVWGAVHPLDGGLQDHQLFRTDLGVGLAVVGLGTLLAALAAIVYAPSTPCSNHTGWGDDKPNAPACPPSATKACDARAGGARAKRG